MTILFQVDKFLFMDISAEIKKVTDPIYQKISNTVPEIEWTTHAPYIYKINKLKKKKNAVILAHNYQTPEIYHGISDFSADSLALAVEAAKTEADIIVMCGVHFMAETAKLMSPDKKVLLPDMSAGCSLSSSITGEDVRKLKKQYPGVPVVSYVNTSADVKAETDVCCTSANAVKIVNSMNSKKVIFLPDDYLAKYVASQTDVEIISWKGTCEVHEQFNDEEINEIRKNNPGIKIIAHPECPPDVIKASDFTGSTSGMIKYVKDNQPEKVMMVTECSMSDNVQVDNPNVKFIRPCNLCPHMKKITLPKILDCLENETNEIIMDSITIEKARNSVERMVKIGR
jgi:quinolinate synthase